MKKILLYVLLFVFSLQTKAQLAPKEKIAVDSLREIIKTSKNDTIKIKAIQSWDNLIYNFDPELDYKLNQQIIEICIKNLNRKNLTKKEIYFFKLEKGSALNILGFYENTQSNYIKALTYFDQALYLFKQINDKEGIAGCYNNMGNSYMDQSNYLTAIGYFTKSMKIYNELKDEEKLSTAQNNMGLIFYNLKDYEKAENYYLKSLKIKEKLNDKKSISLAYNNLGNIYYVLKDLKKTNFYYLKSLQYRLEIADHNGIAMSYNNLALLKKEAKEFKAAENYYTKSLEYRRKAKNLSGESITLTNLGVLFFETNRLQLAKTNGEKAYQIAQNINSLEEQKEALNLLLMVSKKEKNYKKSFEYYEKYVLINDSLANINSEREVFKKEFEYELDKKTTEDSIRNVHQKTIYKAKFKAKDEQIKRINTQRFALYGGICLLLMFLYFIYRRFKFEREQKTKITSQHLLLEEKSKEITASITYAKRIQSAILPSENEIRSYFPNSFILYIPKDIVAGDFYWLEVIGDLIFFAAADCTGHGVPGAMVSVVCHNALNRSVKEFNLKMPNQILDKTREIVIAEFAKSDEDVKDGMDISLCVFNLKERKLFWSGAHNPLWICRNQEIIEYKADKQPIGKFAHAKEFTLHELKILSEDEIYFFTDGFQDQFGGEKGKKYKVSQMRELFLSLTDKSMEEKEEIIDIAFETWKGGLEQVDDVCLIGVKI